MRGSNRKRSPARRPARVARIRPLTIGSVLASVSLVIVGIVTAPEADSEPIPIPTPHLASALEPSAEGPAQPSGPAAAESVDRASEPTTLRSPADFASIAERASRSRALFEEIGKVLTHPRCTNCHPSGDRPRQGDTSRLHQPRVRRGRTGFGSMVMKCSTCHGDENTESGEIEIPGAPLWHLAPLSMAWEGLSLSQICQQFKDPARNGDRDLEALVEYLSSNPLVAWAWTPGAGREAVPGTLETFAALARAWAETGAECP